MKLELGKREEKSKRDDEKEVKVEFQKSIIILLSYNVHMGKQLLKWQYLLFIIYLLMCVCFSHFAFVGYVFRLSNYSILLHFPIYVYILVDYHHYYLSLNRKMKISFHIVLSSEIYYYIFFQLSNDNSKLNGTNGRRKKNETVSFQCHVALKLMTKLFEWKKDREENRFCQFILYYMEIELNVII